MRQGETKQGEKTISLNDRLEVTDAIDFTFREDSVDVNTYEMGDDFTYDSARVSITLTQARELAFFILVQLEKKDAQVRRSLQRAHTTRMRNCRSTLMVNSDG